MGDLKELSKNYRYRKWWEIYQKIIDSEKNDLSPAPTPSPWWNSDGNAVYEELCPPWYCRVRPVNLNQQNNQRNQKKHQSCDKKKLLGFGNKFSRISIICTPFTYHQGLTEKYWDMDPFPHSFTLLNLILKVSKGTFSFSKTVNMWKIFLFGKKTPSWCFSSSSQGCNFLGTRPSWTFS